MDGSSLFGVAVSAWLVCALLIAHERKHGRSLACRLPEWMFEQPDDCPGLELAGDSEEWSLVKFVDGHLVDRVSETHATLCNCDRSSPSVAEDATAGEGIPWSTTITV